eukprot:g2529.t1
MTCRHTIYPIFNLFEMGCFLPLGGLLFPVVVVTLFTSCAEAAQEDAVPGRQVNMMLSYGYNASLQHKWCTHGVSRNLTELVEGYRYYSLPGLFRVDLVFVNFTKSKEGKISVFKDWEKRLEDTFAAASVYMTDSDSPLRGFFVGDELTAQGLPVKALKMVVDKLRAMLDSLGGGRRILYYNDSIFLAAWTENIPFNLTHFSMDYYHAKSTGRVGKTVWDLFEEFVFPKLGNRTKVLFVPPTFGSKVDARPAFTLENFEKWALGNISQYVAWSNKDDRIVGFNPWHLLDRPVRNASVCNSHYVGCAEIGSSSLPRVYAALQRLGESIKARTMCSKV